MKCQVDSHGLKKSNFLPATCKTHLALQETLPWYSKMTKVSVVSYEHQSVPDMFDTVDTFNFLTLIVIIAVSTLIWQWLVNGQLNKYNIH